MAKRTVAGSSLLCIALALAGCGMELEPAPPLGQSRLDAKSRKPKRGPRALRNGAGRRNAAGAAASFSTHGRVDLDGAFFQDFGTNGRTCGTCHTPEEGWSIAADRMQARFDATGGLHPVFRLVDGATSPDADVSTLETRREAYRLLLARGVIRVGIGVPDGADFELVAVDDPYGYASAAELSLFRRPLPAANLGFIPAVMWDGRETAGVTIEDALGGQANGATLGHAQAAAPLSLADELAIVDFESSLTHAQVRVRGLGPTDAQGGLGGPALLADQAYVSGPMILFDAWDGAGSPARRAVARGQRVFNEAQNARGFRCGGCHDAQNVGTSVAVRFFDVGVSHGARRAPEVPLYILRKLATGEELATTDPGRALITGRWSDVNRFKVPGLRGLSARAPYFHDGSAATLADVVEHYEDALDFDFTPRERADLIAFLSAL